MSPSLGKYLEKFKQNGDVSFTFFFFLLMGEDCSAKNCWIISSEYRWVDVLRVELKLCCKNEQIILVKIRVRLPVAENPRAGALWPLPFKNTGFYSHRLSANYLTQKNTVHLGCNLRPAIHLSRNMRKWLWNAKNEKCIAGYFAYFFGVSRPVFRFLHFAQGSVFVQKVKWFRVFFFVTLLKHEIRMKYEKCTEVFRIS